MSDSVKKWHEMKEESKNPITKDKPAKYLFLLDFTDGKVYRYDVSALCTEVYNWNPGTESCEMFLELAGHKVNNCEWMITSEEFIRRGN